VRICYVLPRPELGGGNKVIFQHAHLLRELDWEVTTVGEGPAPDWVRLAVPYHDYAAGLPSLPSQDLVVATYFPTLAIAERLALGPLAHFCQGYEGGLEHLFPRREEIEAVYRQRVPTLTVSPHLGMFLAERFGRESRPAPPPVDRRFRPRLRWRPRAAPWIVVPGIFEAPVKGVETALRAVVRLRARGLPCRVLRLSGLSLSNAERAILPPDRYFCGVSPGEVAAAVRRADLLLFPSRPEEGFGLPLLEAMAAKVPAVASRIPSTEYIAGAARLVPVGDDEAFAAAAWELLTQAPLWRQARRAGQRAAERFLPAAVLPILEQSFTWAVSFAGRAVSKPVG
jgi:glycosyltransferase involved in cell wall biosynthesis